MPLTTPHPIDERAGELLRDLHASPDSQSWDAIAARLPPPPARRRAGAWWPAALLALAVVAGVVFAQAGRRDLGALPVPRSAAGAQSAMLAAAGATSALPLAGELPRSTTTPPTPPRRAAAPGRRPTDSGRERREGANPGAAPYPLPDARPAAPTLPPGESGGLVAPPRALAPPALALLERERAAALPPLPCETFRASAPWAYRVRLFGGAGPTRRTFATDPASSPYARLRDSVEALQLTPHLGLRFELVHGTGFFARAGVDYAMYRSRVTLLGPLEERTTVIDVSDPVTGELVRTDTVRERFRRESVVYNRHQTLALVAGFGYRHVLGRLQPYLAVEAGHEVLLRSRGVLPRPGGEVQGLRDTEANWIARQPGLRYGGTAGVDVGLGGGWFAGVSVQLQLGRGLRGADDPLDYGQRSWSGTLGIGRDL